MAEFFLVRVLGRLPAADDQGWGVDDGHLGARRGLESSSCFPLFFLDQSESGAKCCL